MTTAPTSVSRPVTAAVTAPATDEHPNLAGARWLAVLRVATGFIFLWAFLDKLFGLGYSTPSANAWIHGGSPTKGFLSHVAVGPFQSLFHSIAGTWWADTLFMIGLGAVGIAVILGVGMRIAAWGGAILMLLMWVAEWPFAQFTAAGAASGSTNPVVDYHIIYALTLIVLAAYGAGKTWGLGPAWAQMPLVQRHGWLR
jgi:thiosulfate dehydrogenase [quinone] large subunit